MRYCVAQFWVRLDASQKKNAHHCTCNNAQRSHPACICAILMRLCGGCELIPFILTTFFKMRRNQNAWYKSTMRFSVGGKAQHLRRAFAASSPFYRHPLQMRRFSFFACGLNCYSRFLCDSDADMA